MHKIIIVVLFHNCAKKRKKKKKNDKQRSPCGPNSPTLYGRRSWIRWFMIVFPWYIIPLPVETLPPNHCSPPSRTPPPPSPPFQPCLLPRSPLSSCTRSPATPLRGSCPAASHRPTTSDDPGKFPPPSLSPSPCCRGFLFLSRARPFTSSLHLAPCFTEPRARLGFHAALSVAARSRPAPRWR
jgi:hypothetical protein